MLSALFGVTTFLSAFLLFQVQPLIAKAILPWFGGTPAVWSTCMLCFQLLLLGGYLYVHVLLTRVPARRQPVVHASLLLAGALLLRLVPARPGGAALQAAPILAIATLLARHVALPYFVLATTAPLVHALYARTFPGRAPYRLYALSNAGSLLALVSYPFVIEPALPLGTQSTVWSGLFRGYVALALAVLVVTSRGATPVAALAGPRSWPGRDRALTFLFSAAGSTLLLAVTNHLCHDVATVPFLWVLPLSLYLLTFILCFESERWYARGPFTVLTIACILLFSQGHLVGGGVHFGVAASLALLTLFSCCMTCHGELARLRPAADAASSFYLTLSAGGAAGGVFVGLVAPYAFTGYHELPTAFVAILAGLLWVYCFDERSPFARRHAPRVFAYATFSFVGFVAAVAANAFFSSRLAVEQTRNFYGVLRVLEKDPDDPSRHKLLHTHGRIVHGAQFQAPPKQGLPTEYFGEDSGIGQLLRATEGHPRRIGIIGLGVGVIAVYGRAGDDIQYYEINPDVIGQARRHFTFLGRTAGALHIVEGDARLSLEQVGPQAFDVFVVDAFSGDSIPAHLLTEEAFALYASHLAPGGVLALNISNRHLDLRPIVWATARRSGWASALVYAGEDLDRGTVASEWALLARAPEGSAFAQRFAWMPPDTPHDRLVRWTDQFSNLFSVLRRDD